MQNISITSSPQVPNVTNSSNVDKSFSNPSPEANTTTSSSPIEPPQIEPNSLRDPVSIEEAANFSEKRTNEPEHIIEWGGPNNRYGKLNTMLGKGAYKIVWKAIDKEEGIEVAWNCCQTTRSEFNEINDEVEILKKVRHPNVITLHDSWYHNGEYIFITELMTSGTLREYIQKFKNPSIKLIRRWARQILRGLAHLHSQSPPIIHRDIKCDNLFVNGSHGEIKIGDMGTAKMKFGKKYTVIGTPEFMAPEMYEEKGYNEKVDIYAFGMCLLEMVTGEYPYGECKNAAQIYKKVTMGVRPDCLGKVQDKEILGMIGHCLAPEGERWSAKKLLDHLFLLEDPEVSLIAANDGKSKLKLQVTFKGHDKHTVKFEFNRETDTAEDVVREMIEEKVLASKFQGTVCNEIHRILRDLNKINISSNDQQHRRLASEMDGLAISTRTGAIDSPSTVITTPKQENGNHPQGHLLYTSSNITKRSSMEIRQSISSSDGCTNTTESEGIGNGPILHGPSLSSHHPTQHHQQQLSVSSSSGIILKEYPNEVSVDDFIMEIAAATNRPLEKAQEWLSKLKSQDIVTVGDLRELLDDDWSKLNLTVFAARTIRTALKGKLRIDSLSPGVSGKAPIFIPNNHDPNVASG